MSYDQAAHHAAMLEIEHEIAQIESAALYRPLTVEEVTLLQWATGVKAKENKREMV